MTVESVLFLGFLLTLATLLYGFAIMVNKPSISFLFTFLSSMTFVALAIELSEYTILVLVFIGIVVFQLVTSFYTFRGSNNE